MPITGTPKDLSDRSFNFGHPLFTGIAAFYWGGQNSNLLVQRPGSLFDGGFSNQYSYVDSAIPGVTGGKALRNGQEGAGIYLEPPTTPLTNDLPGTYNDFTILYWGKVTTGGTLFQFFNQSDNQLLRAYSFIGAGDADGSGHNLGFRVDNGATNENTFAGGALEKNVFVNLAFRRSGNTVAIFKNGSLAGDGASTVGALTFDGSVMFNRPGTVAYSNFAQTEVSLFLVYKRALSDSEISQLYANPFVFLPDPGGNNPNPPQSPYRKTARAYHLGNSVTDTIQYSKFQTITRANSVDYLYGRQVIPGAPLEWIWDHPTEGFNESPYGRYPNALPNFDWDVLTLQPFDRGLTEDIRDCGRFMDLLYSRPGNAQTKVLIYSRWTRQQETSPGSNVYETYNFPLYWAKPYTQSNEGKDYFERLLLGVRANYPGKPVFMAPVGDAILKFDTEARSGNIPGFTQALGLFADGIHLTDVGAYLVGCVFYATMYGETPIGLTYTGYSGVNQTLATKIQTIAWETVLDHPYSGVTSSSLASPVFSSLKALDAVLNAGTRCFVGEINLNRQLPTFEIENTIAAANGSTSLTLKSNAGNLWIYRGQVVAFPGVSPVTIAQDILLTATAQSIPLFSPINGALAVGAKSEIPKLFPVGGGSKAGFELDTNEVSKRSFEAGLSDDAVKVSVSANIPWEGFFVKNDPAIAQLISPNATSKSEIYAKLLYPDGLERSGSCFINGFKEDASLDEIRRISWTFRFVGKFSL
jgi:hypothetical protein